MMLISTLFACSLSPDSPASSVAVELPGRSFGPANEVEGNAEPVDHVVVREPASVVRFIAIGDAGTGYDSQFEVADLMKAICESRGCDFAIYLGDNFYDTGVDDLYDPQWEEKFEIPYAEIDFPFYVTLGNHDYGGGGGGYEFWKEPLYVQYTDISEKWVFPNAYFRLETGVADFYSLDTTAMYWGFIDDQQTWLDQRLLAGTAPWNFAFGHHPYISNGPHGNAGVYDGYDEYPISDGEYVKEFMEESVCGSVDVYFCGHDHSLQWLMDTCEGTEFIVSGAGSKTSGVDVDENPFHFQESSPGFVWVEVDETSMKAAFYTALSGLRYERTLTKD